MVAVIVACGGASVGSYEPPIPPGNQGTLPHATITATIQQARMDILSPSIQFRS